MTDDKTGLSLGMKIDLGIAECIKAFDTILERRSQRKQDSVRDTADDLEAIDAIVHTLFNAFRKLLEQFRDKAVVTDPAKLRTLVKATDDYLGERELLRPLQKLGGEMSGRVKARKLNKDASKAVTAVVGKLAEFEERINYSGQSGVGWRELIALNDLARRCLDDREAGRLTNLSNNEREIVAVSQTAWELFDHGPIAEIHRLIGEAKGTLS